MPETLPQLFYLIAAGLLGITGTLAGVVYKNIDSKIEKLDSRVTALEHGIERTLEEILRKLEEK